MRVWSFLFEKIPHGCPTKGNTNNIQNTVRLIGDVGLNLTMENNDLFSAPIIADYSVDTNSGLLHT